MWHWLRVTYSKLYISFIPEPQPIPAAGEALVFVRFFVIGPGLRPLMVADEPNLNLRRVSIRGTTIPVTPPSSIFNTKGIALRGKPTSEKGSSPLGEIRRKTKSRTTTGRQAEQTQPRPLEYPAIESLAVRLLPP
jgi:hypothetical protein